MIAKRNCDRGGGCRRLPERRSGRGFTLIELMVALAICVVLMMVAAPSMIQYRRNMELADAVSSFMLAANAAKSAALKTGRNAYLQANSGGWSSGWIVYTDRNGNGAYDSGTDELVMDRLPLSSEIVTSAANTTTLGAGYLMFNGSGFPRDKAGSWASGTLSMATTDRASDIIVSKTGRLRSCRPNYDPDC